MTQLWLSVDVEGDIQEYLRGSSLGLEVGLPGILSALDEARVPADFFVLGELAERDPDIVRNLAQTSLGIGSHGYRHEYLCTKSFSDQEREIRRSLEAVREITGRWPQMFRAPNFSANGDTVRVLEGLGVPFDSSVLPGRRKTRWRVLTLYDHQGAPRLPYRPSPSNIVASNSSGVWELPVTENPLQRGAPIGLGFLNQNSVEATVRAIERAAGAYVAFLVHPWEAVDLPVAEKGLPKWLESACRSDLGSFRSFLKIASSRWGFTTCAEIARTLGGSTRG